MVAEVAEVDNYQHESLGDECRKQRHDTEVPDLSGVESSNACGPLSKKQGHQNTGCRHGAIRRNENCADVDENWMHQSKDTAFALSGASTQGICKEGRIRPAGPWLMRR